VMALAAVSGFRFDAVEAGLGMPAKALIFPGPAASDWNDIYTARSAITDGDGGRRNYFDYHQIRRDDGSVIAVALKHPFIGDALWYGTAPPQLLWPAGNPAADRALVGPWPRRPIRRLSGRLSFGYPCWLPPFGCPQTLAE
jgi:hypothetical protein